MTISKGRKNLDTRKPTAVPKNNPDVAGTPAGWRGSIAVYLSFFLLIYATLYAIYHALQTRGALESYASWLAASAARTLSLLDPTVRAENNIIIHNGIPALKIVSDCDGLAFVILISAAVLPFAKPMSQRLIGLLVLAPLLLLINWLRIVVLAILAFYTSIGFHFAHLYLFQAVMILITLLCFVCWIMYGGSSRPTT
jgi:exosortase/archaeosortase family protein